MIKKGFSIIELLVVLLIVGVLFSLIFASSTSFFAVTRDRNVKNSFDLAVASITAFVVESDRIPTSDEFKSMTPQLESGYKFTYTVTDADLKVSVCRGNPSVKLQIEDADKKVVYAIEGPITKTTPVLARMHCNDPVDKGVLITRSLPNFFAQKPYKAFIEYVPPKDKDVTVCFVTDTTIKGSFVAEKHMDGKTGFSSDSGRCDDSLMSSKFKIPAGRTTPFTITLNADTTGWTKSKYEITFYAIDNSRNVIYKQMFTIFKY